jgi:hypothetical protein
VDDIEIRDGARMLRFTAFRAVNVDANRSADSAFTKGPIRSALFQQYMSSVFGAVSAALRSTAVSYLGKSIQDPEDAVGQSEECSATSDERGVPSNPSLARRSENSGGSPRASSFTAVVA